MRIDEAIYSFLSTTAGITAVVSTRTYPVRLPPAATLPALTYQQISSRPIQTMGSSTQGKTDRWQITAWGTKYGDARAAAAAVIAAWNQFSGLMGGGSGVTVAAAQAINELDLIDPETQRYYVVIDFEVTYG